MNLRFIRREGGQAGSADPDWWHGILTHDRGLQLESEVHIHRPELQPDGRTACSYQWSDGQPCQAAESEIIARQRMARFRTSFFTEHIQGGITA